MKIFMTGATGYIGGSVATALIDDGHEITGLVRSEHRAEELKDRGIDPLIGTLDDSHTLTHAAHQADAIINAADSDHSGSAAVILAALGGSNKLFVHTSGSSIVGTQAEGQLVDEIFDEDTPFKPSPGREARVKLNEDILEATRKGIRTVILCPSLIYGEGRGCSPNSMQIPWLLQVARKYGVAKHIGPGKNLWSNIHIDDLVLLYRLAMEKAPAGSFFFAENGENSMREVCEAINRMMGVSLNPQSMTIEEASREWGEGTAQNTMGSNSRVRAKHARQQLGWAPSSPTLIEEIERGCYTG